MILFSADTHWFTEFFFKLSRVSQIYRARAASFLKLYATRDSCQNHQDLQFEDRALGAMKTLNLGVPFFVYGCVELGIHAGVL